MPWAVRFRPDGRRPYKIVKIHPDGREEVVGASETKKDAEASVRAREANSKD